MDGNQDKSLRLNYGQFLLNRKGKSNSVALKTPGKTRSCNFASTKTLVKTMYPFFDLDLISLLHHQQCMKNKVIRLEKL
jgi:hypothetical protein